MSLPKERIWYLLDAYVSNRATSIEEDELMEWIVEAGEDSELKPYILDLWNQRHQVSDFSYVNWDDLYSRAIQVPAASAQPKIARMHWGRLVAAAAALVILVAGTYVFFVPPSQKALAVTKPAQKDIPPPSSNKAVLTLASGTQVEIDKSANGTIAIQDGVQIIKRSTGEISYAGAAGGEISFNTMNIPKGGKPLSLVLSDSTRVWLNVGSRLTYPTAFTGSERRVNIIGEAYFEVAHNARIPFIVQHDKLTVHVLGTRFNVNTYEDEAAQRITLLDGLVRVDKNAVSRLLRPGQQGQINDSETKNIEVLNNVNIEEVMAWKNDKFVFGENTDIGAIMRQISRWYNVDIEYKGKINQRFWGSISKDVNVSQVLKIFEATGGVKFEVQGNKIIVMPAAP